MKIIKIGIRHNLLYPMMAIIFGFFGDLDSIIIQEILHFSNKFIFAAAIFLSEFIFGSFFYIYQKKLLSIEKHIINKKENISPIDKYNSISNKLKRHLLLLANSFFVLAEYVIEIYFFPEYAKSLDIRLRSIITFWLSFFCYFLLKMPVAKHQKCSLITIFICLLLMIILEGVFDIIYHKDRSLKFIKIIGLYFIRHIFSAILEVNQKYLLDYELLDPFYILMIEGIYGFIFINTFYLTVDGKFDTFKKISLQHKNNIISLIFLIICLFLYFIFSGGRNVYRLLTNKIYSPMAKTLIDCFFVPLLIIFYYSIKQDFLIGEKDEQSFPFFICNLILSIIIVFCNCVYNDLFILYCCGLEYNTFNEISARASLKYENGLQLRNNKIEINDGNNYYYYSYEDDE